MSSFQPLIIAASGAFLFLICLNNHVFNYAPKLDLWLECTKQKRKYVSEREKYLKCFSTIFLALIIETL